MQHLLFLLFRLFEKSFRSKKPENEVYTSVEGSKEELDETGRLTTSPVRYQTYIDLNQNVYVQFPNSLAHSFWRSQEVSIFKQAAKKYQYPLLDFGCGDGSLSAAILDQIDYGIDIDLKALQVAKGFNLYKHLLTFEEMVNSLDSNSIGSVISVSVLEHTTNLSKCIQEIYRVLKEDGTFFITVPNINFTNQMISLANKDFADFQNKKMYHRNLLSRDEWVELLESTGFSIISFDEFQPIAYTRKYFNLSLLGSKSLGRFKIFRNFFEKYMLNKNLKDVQNSLHSNISDGANFYIIAKK